LATTLDYPTLRVFQQAAGSDLKYCEGRLTLKYAC